MRRGARRVLIRILYTFLILTVGVTIGKICQYTAMLWLGPFVGFTTASLIGLVPFAVAMIVLKAHYPRYFKPRGRDAQD